MIVDLKENKDGSELDKIEMGLGACTVREKQCEIAQRISICTITIKQITLREMTLIIASYLCGKRVLQHISIVLPEDGHLVAVGKVGHIVVQKSGVSLYL